MKKLLQAFLILSLPAGVFLLAKSLGRIVYTGDNITYILVSKSVFSHSPYMKSIIGYFFFEHPLHYHYYENQPLFAFALAFGSFIAKDLSLESQYFVGVLSNSLITLFSAWAFYKLLNTIGVESKFLRYLGVGLLLLLPGFAINAVVVHSEILYLGLLFFHLHFFIGGIANNKPLWRAGFLLGLLYLCRSNAFFIAFADLLFILIFTIFNKHSIKIFTSHLKQFLVPFVLVASPWWIRNYLIFGDPIFSVHKFVVWVGFNDFSLWKTPPSLEYYLSIHTLRNFVNAWGGRVIAILTFLSSPNWVSLFVISVLGAPFFDRKKRWVLFLFSLIFLADLSGQGLHFLVMDRHILTFDWIFVALAMLSIHTLYSKVFLEKKPIPIALKISPFLIAIPLLLYSSCYNLNYFKDRYLTLKNNSTFDQELKSLGLWLRENLPSGARVLATPPDGIHFFSGAPTVNIPDHATSSDIADLIQKHSLSYYVKGDKDPLPPSNFREVKVFEFKALGKKIVFAH